jgi:hypothetical protein
MTWDAHRQVIVILVLAFVIGTPLFSQEYVSRAPFAERVYLDRSLAPDTFQPWTTKYDFFPDGDKGKDRRFLYALGDLGMNLGVQTIGYFSSPGSQDVDYSWRDGFHLFFRQEKWRFDDNDWVVNQIGHPISGQLSYMAFRTRNYPVSTSFLAGVAVSTLWEWSIELREKTSWNDLLVTPFAGAIMGEVYYQFQSAFSQGRDHWANRLWLVMVNPHAHTNRFVYRQGRTQSDLINRHGFAVKTGRMLRAFSEGRYPGILSVGLSGEKWLELSSVESDPAWQWVDDTPIAQFQTQAGIGFRQGMDWFWHFRTALGAFIYTFRKSDVPNDFSVQAWLAPVHRWRSEMYQAGDQDDYSAQLAPLGLTTGVQVQLRDWKLHVSFDGSADFTATRSHAFLEARQEQNVEGTSSILQRHGYYFGRGYSLYPAITIHWKKWGLRYSGLFHRTQSWNGLARSQELITLDWALSDQRVMHDFLLYYRVSDFWEVGAGFQKRMAESSISGRSLVTAFSHNQPLLRFSYRMQ